MEESKESAVQKLIQKLMLWDMMQVENYQFYLLYHFRRDFSLCDEAVCSHVFPVYFRTCGGGRAVAADRKAV